MSLTEFQRAFADLIASPENCVLLREEIGDALANYEVTPRERRRLVEMVRHEAMSVNCSLYRVNRLIPIYSVLPHTCRLLSDRLVEELDAFWAASRYATLQYRWEAWRFGVWLQERIDAGLLPAGPLKDVIRLELAIFDVQTATRTDRTAVGGATDGRVRIVLLRYDPNALLDPAFPLGALEPLTNEIAIVVDATGEQVSISRAMQ